MELTRNLMVESVSRLSPTPPHRVPVTCTVAEAVDVLRRERVGCVLVVRDGELVGIFTERDLLTKVLAPGEPLHTPLATVMTANPVSVNLKESVRTAVERMQKGGYRHVPVVDENNHPVGVLSAKRVVHYLVEHFPATVYNQPPDPTQVPNSPEGA
jgi:CBS domain-containing protein